MKRTVSTPHLVLGIIFAGIATLWFVGAATDAKFHDTAPGFPLVLIGAGVIGLVASLTNSRTRKQALAATAEASVDEVDDTATETETGTETENNDTAVIGGDTEATTVIQEDNR
ncbi:hypothetical protein [Nocardioides marmorisolisilvae]|uniref:Uncharacterized protein n=1 Tax=Nocardioides marmorisolisilvae TaxID=1542737 RepID=A0A3N0DRX2_9ACTN|nr:hypothetical protein [Nocardioides marmorisolisilvae]RNL78388.1 hypothetical protein EFL95_04610 [Nocardioides marmorisolisilvae]